MKYSIDYNYLNYLFLYKASVGADETLLMWRCFDTFKFKNNKWVEVKKIKKEKENLSPTKRLLASSDYLNRLNIR